jgi:hypothetical protein
VNKVRNGVSEERPREETRDVVVPTHDRSLPEVGNVA